MIPLTSPFFPDYASLTSANSEAGIGVLVLRRTTASARLFFCPLNMAPVYGWLVWGAERLAGSLVRYANLHESAHPIGVGRAENLNRLLRNPSHE